MELLQREVDVEPGKDLYQLPANRAGRGNGGVVLRIKNTTEQIIEYKVFVQSGRDRDLANPYWQEHWYYFKAQEVEAAEGSATSLPDRYGQAERDVTLNIPKGGERLVYLLFNVKKRVESRAGRYPVEVVIESSVSDGAAAISHRFALDVYIQPFYNWSIKTVPESAKTTFWKRRGETNLAVVNESNDWLYADITVPAPKEFAVTTLTTRVAVRPPEASANETRSVHRIPLPFTAKVAPFRGEIRNLPVGVSAVRVDAPSVPRPLAPEVINSRDTGAILIDRPGSELKTLPPDVAQLVYHPQIPNTLIGVFTAIQQSIVLIVGIVVGGYLLMWGLAWTISQTYQKKPEASGDVPQAKKEGYPVLMKSQGNIAFTEYFVRKAGEKDWVPVENQRIGDWSKKEKSTMAGAPASLNLNTSAFTLFLPEKDYKNTTVQIGFRWRVWFLPPIQKDPILCKPTELTLGKLIPPLPPKIIFASPVVDINEVKPGGTITATLPAGPGGNVKTADLASITVLGKKVKGEIKDGKLVIPVPADTPTGSGSVVVKMKGGSELAPFAITIPAPPTPEPIPTPTDQISPVSPPPPIPSEEPEAKSVYDLLVEKNYIDVKADVESATKPTALELTACAYACIQLVNEGKIDKTVYSRASKKAEEAVTPLVTKTKRTPDQNRAVGLFFLASYLEIRSSDQTTANELLAEAGKIDEVSELYAQIKP